MSVLMISLQRISPTHHRFRYDRPDGTGEAFELETKSFLFHDFLHFAVEREARLRHSFYGQLFLGNSHASLSEGRVGDVPELLMTDRVVGALTGLLKQVQPDVSVFLVLFDNWLEATNELRPRWLDEQFVERVTESIRRLQGEWQGTPFGAEMRLYCDWL